MTGEEKEGRRAAAGASRFSGLWEQQQIVTRKRRRTHMATAVETPLVVPPKTSSRTRNGCTSKAAEGTTGRKSSKSRNGHIGCHAENKRIVSRHVNAESSAVNSSILLEGPQTPSPSPVNGFYIHEPQTTMASRQKEDKSSHDNSLIPGLNDQLAISIIALLPVSLHNPLKLVSKRWLKALSSSTQSANEVMEARKLSGITEQWVFLLASSPQHIYARWRAFDPVHSLWKWLPKCPCDYVFDSCDKESAVAGTQLLFIGHSRDGATIWRYDNLTDKWTKAPKMIQTRCLFASASLGVYAYFAGGQVEGVCMKYAERYNSQSETWEPLPDLHVSRKGCSGCILDGKFFVIGGHGTGGGPLTSGEYYDEAEGKWVIVQNMWPASPTNPVQTAPPLVAVVDNELYAVDATTMELISYDKARKTWRRVGPVPYRGVSSRGWGMGVKAVQKEMFVIGGASDRGNDTSCDMIHAWAPVQTHGEDAWRQVCQLQQLSCFIYNCAVMNV